MKRVKVTDQKIEYSSKYVRVKTTEGNESREDWLPFESVDKELIVDYYKELAEKGKLVNNTVQNTEILFQKFAAVPESLINDSAKSFSTPRGLQFPPSKRANIIEKLSDLPRSFQASNHACEKEMVDLRREIIIEKLLEKREKQLKNLKVVEEDINARSNEKIIVENNHDLEQFSYNFKYINNLFITLDSGIEESMYREDGCKCGDCSKSSHCCGSSQTFTRRGKPGSINIAQSIYECNERCACAADPERCANRLTQKKNQIVFVLFKTFNRCGFGVRTRNLIEEGAFVARYVGKLISATEIEKRTRKQSEDFSPYIFGLGCKKHNQFPDFGIDAKEFGNISRFFNHCCDPNLGTARVYIDFEDKRLYEIAFFAARDIKPGEELCLDYGIEYEIECRCGAEACRSRNKDEDFNGIGNYSIRRSGPWS